MSTAIRIAGVATHRYSITPLVHGLLKYLKSSKNSLKIIKKFTGNHHTSKLAALENGLKERVTGPFHATDSGDVPFRCGNVPAASCVASARSKNCASMRIKVIGIYSCAMAKRKITPRDLIIRIPKKFFH